MKNFLKLNGYRTRNWVGFSCLLLSFLAIGCNRDPEIAKLINELSDDEAGDRYDAAKELESLGVRAAPAVDELAKCLSDSDARVRYRAAKALANIGGASKTAAADLGVALANDTDEQVRYFAAKTLATIADQAPTEVAKAMDGLVKGLSDENSRIRYYSAKSLGKIGADAQVALGALEKLMEDSDESARKAAESAIRRIKKNQSSS